MITEPSPPIYLWIIMHSDLVVHKTQCLFLKTWRVFGKRHRVLGEKRRLLKLYVYPFAKS